MAYEHITVEREGPVTRVTMNRPQRRNALSLAHLRELLQALREVGESDARAVVLAGNGPAFSAGHDFADMAGADLVAMRELLWTCTDLMDTMQRIPQVVVARVHAVATAAGCQLVATADLAVAAESARFAAPGGKGGWFCTTPMVAIGRTISRKHALELALTGDDIDAATALEWGLVNAVVPPEQLDEEVQKWCEEILEKSPTAISIAKRSFNADSDNIAGIGALGMQALSLYYDTDESKEGVKAFREKRKPEFRKYYK